MASETSAQPDRERRLATLRERTRSRRASETAEAREQRLATLLDQTRSRRASETAEAREQRLATLREKTRSRRASETAEARERRLAAQPTSRQEAQPTSRPSLTSLSAHLKAITQESSATCHSCSLHSTPRKVHLVKKAPVLAMGEGHFYSCMPFMHTLLP